MGRPSMVGRPPPPPGSQPTGVTPVVGVLFGVAPQAPGSGYLGLSRSTPLVGLIHPGAKQLRRWELNIIPFVGSAAGG